jgi:glutamate--cysteine ligase
MAVLASADDARPIRDFDELSSVFRQAEKPESEWRIGAEAEKFAVFAETGAPLDYADGVGRIFAALEAAGWQPERESHDGPVIALRRGGASVTLEPGAQVELSGSALSELHGVSREIDEHLAELRGITRELGLAWLSVGFHPIAAQAELPWVPKQRYGVMKEYLPTRGYAAHDMMRRTATVQANFDYLNEADAMRKLLVSLRISPLVHALTANAPFTERKRSPSKSLRGEVWRHMDPSRSGLIPRVLDSKRPSYRDYVEWALDAGMFLFKRGERVYANTGQTFRSFLSDGFEGERATLGDFRLHLNTLFPEVRLKNTLEARSCDAQDHALSMAVPALFTGILYDEKALGEVEELTRSFDFATLEAAREAMVRDALAAELAGQPVRAFAERLLDIAAGGLTRRARKNDAGEDESKFLAPLIALTSRGQCPADRLVAGLLPGAELPVSELIQRTQLGGPLAV